MTITNQVEELPASVRVCTIKISCLFSDVPISLWKLAIRGKTIMAY